jgi:hypothetical protein
METILIAGALTFFGVLYLSLQPKKNKETKIYNPGTGKTLIHKQGWTYTDLDCNGGSSHSAMEIVNQHRWLCDYAKVVFARTIGVTKTKDFVRDGQDEYTYMIECWNY